MLSRSAAIVAKPEPVLHLRPLAISAGLRDRLARSTPLVLAAHKLGASLALPGCEDAVYMNAPGSGLLPSHIVVRTRDLVRVLDAAEDDAGSGLCLRLETQGVRTFRTQLPAQATEMRTPRALANIDALAASLRAGSWQLGFGRTADEILASSRKWRDCLYPGSGEAYALESRLRSLIGRGSGTTPAGDDFLVGMLACVWSMQGRDAPLIRTMRLIAPELETLTTTTGATYLRAATRGEFGSHLIVWVRALPHATRVRALALAQRVANHGATSGGDTLIGFVAAAQALRARSGRTGCC